MMYNNKKKVLVAMSGGVDSSAAAAILMQDYNVTGATMRLFTNEDIVTDNEKTCCSLDDAEDARNVAVKLGFPHYVFNFGDHFKEYVIDKFISYYMSGLTPNPCIDCNRYIKFNALLRRAEELDNDFIATGHYVRRAYDSESGRYQLLKGLDPSKDQSYVLYGMTQEQLSRTLFPIGELTKARTREIAEQYGLINARKPDSQDICFVPDGDYAGFIERYTGRKFPCGSFVDLEGKILGEHSGIIRYTIGQRKGLGIALGSPAYVISKDTVSNTVTLGKNEDLFRKMVYARNVNWVSIACPDRPIEVTARIRYNQREQPALLIPLSENEVAAQFREPQRAPAPGQALVFYDGDLMLGGGEITHSDSAPSAN